MVVHDTQRQNKRRRVATSDAEGANLIDVLCSFTKAICLTDPQK